MKKLEIVIRPESLENLELLLEEQKANGMMIKGISSDVPWSGNRGQNASEG